MRDVCVCLDLDARPLLHMWVGKHDHELQGNRTHLGHLNGEVRCCWRCAAGCGGDNSQRLCSRGRCGLLRLRIRRVVQGSITVMPFPGSGSRPALHGLPALCGLSPRRGSLVPFERFAPGSNFQDPSEQFAPCSQILESFEQLAPFLKFPSPFRAVCS